MKNNNWVFWFIGLGSILFMSFILWQNYLYATSLGKDYQGLFGDMFGASNALFTGLSFVGVIIAILLQRQELKLQRNELELTRNEMELTRDEFSTQNETMSIQRFENTFFQLISLHHSIISDLKHSTYKIKNGSRIYTYYEGRNVFTPIVEAIFNNISNDVNSYNIQYKNLYEGLGDKYIHYIRNIFQIVKIVDNHTFNKNEELNRNEKEKYISIVWNQLSDHEITLIFYHSCYEEEISDYKLLIEKYSLFRNIKDIFIYDEFKVLYSNKAYNKKAP